MQKVFRQTDGWTDGRQAIKKANFGFQATQATIFSWMNNTFLNWGTFIKYFRGKDCKITYDCAHEKRVLMTIFRKRRNNVTKM